jgi:hypothetical protein
MVRYEQFLAGLRSERVVLLLEPNELGFEITYSLLEATHLRDHTGIGSADVAE